MHPGECREARRWTGLAPGSTTPAKAMPKDRPVLWRGRVRPLADSAKTQYPWRRNRSPRCTKMHVAQIGGCGGHTHRRTPRLQFPSRRLASHPHAPPANQPTYAALRHPARAFSTLAPGRGAASRNPGWRFRMGGGGVRPASPDFPPAIFHSDAFQSRKKIPPFPAGAAA